MAMLSIISKQRRVFVAWALLWICTTNGQILPVANPASTFGQDLLQGTMAHPNSSAAKLLGGVMNLIESTAVGKVADRAADIMTNGLDAYIDKANYSINPACLDHTQMMIRGIANRETWALRMIDAMGKPRSAIMDVHLIWLGSYEECIATEAPINVGPTAAVPPDSSFTGRYCKASYALAGGQPPFTPTVTIGLCVPNSCTAGDTVGLLNTLTSLVPLNTSAWPTPVVTCQLESLEYTTKSIVVICVCAVFLAVILVGTVYDVATIVSVNGRAKKTDSLGKKATLSTVVAKDKDIAVIGKMFIQLERPVATNGQVNKDDNSMESNSPMSVMKLEDKYGTTEKKDGKVAYVATQMQEKDVVNTHRNFLEKCGASIGDKQDNLRLPCTGYISLYCYESDFMLNLSSDTQSDIIDSFEMAYIGGLELSI